MQIISLSLKNYKQYKEETIQFPEGLIGFIGSNGAGKSTIFEAISWAFYGKFETKKELLKNDKATKKENILVELEFEDRSKNYKVKREIKGTALKVEAEFFIEGVSNCVGVNDVNKAIIKVLKLDFSNFKNSFFASQKEVTSLLNLSNGQREISIRKMLGLEKLDRLDNRIKEKIKELNDEIKANEKNLLSDDEITELDKSKSENETKLKTDQTSFSKSQKETNDFEKSYLKLKDELKISEKLKDEFDSVNKKIELNSERIRNNKSNILNTEKEIRELKNLLAELKILEPQKEKYIEENKRFESLLEIKAEYEKKIQLGKTLVKDKTDLAELQKEKLSFENEIEKLKDVEDKIENHKKLIKAKEETKKSSSKNRDLLNDFISKSKGIINESTKRLRRINEIGKESNCPECERPLENHYDKLVLKYKDAISKNETEIKLRKSELDQVESEIEKLDSELNDFKKQLSKFENDIENRKRVSNSLKEQEKKIDKQNKTIIDSEKALSNLDKITFDEAELSRVTESRKELHLLYEKYNRTKTKTEELPKKVISLSELKEIENKLELSITVLNKELSEIKFDSEAYQNLKEKREESEVELGKLKERVHQIEKEISITKNQILEIEKELAKDKKQREETTELRKRTNLYDRLKAFVVEFKSKITSQELPAISNEASKLFSAITKNRYIDLKIDSEFDFKVGRDDREVELQTLSGGEKDLASLCLRVAISKRISALAGRTNMGFLALDEVFGSQDEVRRDELMTALGKISEEFRQIFVVSHNQDVHESFPIRLSINKVEGYSKAVLN